MPNSESFFWYSNELDVIYKKHERLDQVIYILKNMSFPCFELTEFILNDAVILILSRLYV